MVTHNERAVNLHCSEEGAVRGGTCVVLPPTSVKFCRLNALNLLSGKWGHRHSRDDSEESCHSLALPSVQVRARESVLLARVPSDLLGWSSKATLESLASFPTPYLPVYRSVGEGGLSLNAACVNAPPRFIGVKCEI